MILPGDDVAISTHALREEGDDLRLGIGGAFLLISTHALREEGDIIKHLLFVLDNDFYPRPPRGGRLRRAYTFLCRSSISTHALREEGDPEHIKSCAA